MSILEAQLPANWTWQQISNLYRVTKKPRNTHFNEHEAIPFVPMELVPTNGKEHVGFEMRAPAQIASGTYFEKGDILLSKITPSFENGKQGLANAIPFPFGVASTEVIPLQRINQDVNSRLLFYYLLHPEVRNTIAGKMEGSTGRQRVPERVVLEYPLPTPPREEQDKIAAVLWKVQRAIEVEEKLTATARELKQAAMRQLFTHGLRGETLKETEVGEVPDSWNVCSIRTNAKLIAGGTPQRGESQFWNEGTIPWVKTGEVNYCLITDTEEKITQSGLDNSVAKLLPSDTILVAMYGQGITRGKVAILGIEAATNQACVGLISKNDNVVPKYLYYYLTYSYERLRSLSHGAQQQHLNAELVGSFQVAFPDRDERPEKDEQLEIVRMLSTIDQKIAIHEQKHRTFHELFQTLLHKLMTGEIRVADLDIDVSEVTQ